VNRKGWEQGKFLDSVKQESRKLTGPAKNKKELLRPLFPVLVPRALFLFTASSRDEVISNTVVLYWFAAAKSTRAMILECRALSHRCRPKRKSGASSPLLSLGKRRETGNERVKR
jgi:hypothetical protein